MSTAVRRPDSTVRMYTKGVSEIVLSKCETILDRNGEIVPLTIVDKDRLVETVIQPMASSGLRTICLAYRDFLPDQLPDWSDEDNTTDRLTCICICGIDNSVRSKVPEAIAKCQKAGIIVRLLTEDNVNTARSIALKCGIISLNDNSIVLDGQEFNSQIQLKSNGEVK